MEYRYPDIRNFFCLLPKSTFRIASWITVISFVNKEAYDIINFMNISKIEQNEEF